MQVCEQDLDQSAGKSDELQEWMASYGPDGFGDEALSPEEERFVAAFVDYWLRRGSTIMSSP
jgi:hypothetical protein